MGRTGLAYHEAAASQTFLKQHVLLADGVVLRSLRKNSCFPEAGLRDLGCHGSPISLLPSRPQCACLDYVGLVEHPDFLHETVGVCPVLVYGGPWERAGSKSNAQTRGPASQPYTWPGFTRNPPTDFKFCASKMLWIEKLPVTRV